MNRSVDISEKQPDETKNIVPITVIKNENANVVPLDKDKVRETLSVIEPEKKPPSVLTDEQKHQLEMNRKVLEKVKQYEEETAERREELRKERAERSAKAYEKAFGTVDYITEFETDDYSPEESGNIIKVKAGKFTESVRSEYEFYVGYTRLKNVAKSQTRVESAAARSDTSNSRDVQNTSFSEKIKTDDSRYAEFAEDKFAKSRDKLDSISKRLDYKDEKNPNKLEYRSEDDAVKIKKILQDKTKKESFRWSLSAGLTFAMFLLCCLSGLFTVGRGEAADDSKMRVFAFINLAMYAAMIYNCKDIIISGLRPLRKFKSNSDT